MMVSKLMAIGFIAALLIAGAMPAGAQIAQAVVLEDIEIDGDLSDWPEDMKRYPIRTKVITDESGLREADLESSPDLSPEFRVGYSQKKNLIYVAVEVRDDDLVVGSNYDRTDGVEVYVNRNEHRPMQYAVVPGAGGSYNWNSPNPHLYQGDIYQTRSQAAYSRQGNVTVYEWAVEPYEEYPDRSMNLRPGKKLFFDVVAVDKDHADRGHGFVAWGPRSADKYNGSNRVGRLELTGDVAPATTWWSHADMRHMFADVVDALMAIFIILAIGLAVGIVITAARRPKQGAVAADALENMVSRLEAIEQRLTDTQDVMIDLSEKYDRLEGKYQSTRED